MTYIYRIINNINGKTYIGQRKLKKGKTPLNDKYMGSGIHIKRAIEKYGVENFSKEIIVCFFGDVDNKYTDASEIYYISKERNIKGKENVYNIADGGIGGILSTDIKDKRVISLKKFYETHDGANKGKTLDEEWKKHLSESHKGVTPWNKGKSMDKPSPKKGKKGNPCPWKGKTLDEEWKKHLSESHKGGIPGNKGKHKVILPDGRITYK